MKVTLYPVRKLHGGEVADLAVDDVKRISILFDPDGRVSAISTFDNDRKKIKWTAE
jgi:hypothetical protein